MGKEDWEWGKMGRDAREQVWCFVGLFERHPQHYFAWEFRTNCCVTR